MLFLLLWFSFVWYHKRTIIIKETQNTMKKLIAIILAAVMAFSFAACGTAEPAAVEPTPTPEVTAGVMMSETKLPIGYIPLGTANDVARTLGLSFKPVEAAKNILSGSLFPMDIGKFGPDKFFTYIAAFGAFTEVSYATPSELKHSLGHLAYMLEAAKSITKITGSHAIIEYDGGIIEDDFIFGAISNSTSVAGLFKLDSRDVNLSDGMFEILLIRKPKTLDDLNQILTEILLMNFSNENVFFLKSSKIRLVFSSPTSFTRDGEDGGSHREVSITNCHPGVEIIV